MGNIRKNKTTKERINENLADQKIAAWCIESGYKIYPLPTPECKGKAECNKYKLAIERAGKIKMGKEQYTLIESQNKIWELYHLIYNNKNENKKK